MKPLALLLLCTIAIFAGQSLVQVADSVTIPLSAQSHFSPLRLELYLHDWNHVSADSDILTGTSYASSSAVGFESILRFSNGSPVLWISSRWTLGAPNGNALCTIPLGSLSVKRVYIRAQYDPTNKQLMCEAWDVNGVRFFYATDTWTTDSVTNVNDVLIGGILYGAGESRGLGFIRVHTTLITLNSRVPATSDNASALFHMKFDGNLNDSSGNGHNATSTTGTPVYVQTPDQNVTGVVKVPGAPIWSNTTTLRAGFPNQIDGSSSYSQADGSATVTCFWQVLSGAPSNPVFDDRTSCTPTLTGLIFGDYPVQLTVTDSSAAQGVVLTHLGAVAMDANGVVVQGDPNVEKIFGPMIAYGKNPWGWVDERNMKATVQRSAAYNAGFNPPTWVTPGQGTITYYVNGRQGRGNGHGPGTTLCAAIPDAVTLSITVCDATVLDLSQFPTRIGIGGGNNEEIRICSASGNVLTACYDGRGHATQQLVAAQAWANGSKVEQYKIGGTGTKFLTDPNRPLCPAGAPSEPGRLLETGTATVTAGSATLTGTGTAWVDAGGNTATPGYHLGQPIRITATHSGTPFVFLSTIAAIPDTTHITMGRVYPATADTGSFTYQILKEGQEGTLDYRIVLHFLRPVDSSDSKYYNTLSGCESETDAYLPQSFYDFSVNGTLQSGVQYSTAYSSDTAGYLNGSSTGGINFYGEGLAHRSLYFRSGLKLARDAANAIDDWWVGSPQVAGHDVGNIDLFLGGGVIGGFAAAILDPASKVSWNDLRGFERAAADCTDQAGHAGDLRTQAYHGAWVALAATYDPDPTLRAAALSKLGTIMTSDDTVCKGADQTGVHPERTNSWQAAYVSDQRTLVNLTNGSATYSQTLPISFGGGLVDYCAALASGTAGVTNGSTAVTWVSGGAFVSGAKITLTGTKSGAIFVQFLYFTQNSGTSITLAVPWQGDTETLNFIISNVDVNSTSLSFGSNTNLGDPLYYNNWACTYSAGTVTLNRPWDGPTGTYESSFRNISGIGTQPFMMGIKAYEMKLASQVSDTTIAAKANSLALAAATWVHDYGFDSRSLGMFYARIFGSCEPDPAGSPGCTNDPPPAITPRALSPEDQMALRMYYENNPTSGNKLYGDKVYGGAWGNTAYTTGGVFSDGGTIDSTLTSDGYLAGGKWPGFFFGMGMAHQWPAVRLGGVAPAVNRSVFVGFTLSSHPSATSFQILLTAPSGATSTVACPSSPCIVTADARQGTHLMMMQYLGAGGKVVASSSVPFPAAVQ